MKRWLRSIVWLLEGLIVLGVIYFEPTCCVRGTLWSEAFFEGKPTSYSRGELDHWEVNSHQLLSTAISLYGPNLNEVALPEPTRLLVYSRRDSWIESQRARWIPPEPPQKYWLFAGPKILHGDESAKEVLQALVNDPSPRVRVMAQIGLGMNPRIPGDE